MGNQLEQLTSKDELQMPPQQELQSEDKGDDDTVKVDGGVHLTPQQRAADLLARLTSADAKIARSEVARLKKFRPKLEAEFQQFRIAYAYDDSKNSRALFVQYLEKANLGAKKKAVSADQQANGAMQVLFTDIKSGERLSPTAIGLREALDPRTVLTDDQREKLKGIVLDDGRTALQARLEAEQLWATKKINLVIDVNAAYASGNPHLAAFTSAATDAGYNQNEIDMVTTGATAAQLWRPIGGTDAMPTTLAEYQKKYGTESQRSFCLDVTRLEDARTAIAQGMTLDQLDTARRQQGYDASFRSKMTNDSVSAVVDAYIPMEMRPVVGPLLTALCSPDRAQRNAASKELQALINDSKRFGPSNAKALREAISGLQAQFGMQNDPMLQLLRVQLDFEASPVERVELQDFTQKPFDLTNPTADLRTDNQKKSAEMAAKATKQLEQIREKLREQQEAGTLDREEAARDYEMMGAVFRSYVGDVEKAEWCRTMARMYRSTKEESDEAAKRLASKNPMVNGEVLISRRPPDEPTSMRGPTEDEKELDELEAEDREALAEIEAEMYGKSVELQPGQPRSMQAKTSGDLGTSRSEKVEGAAGVIYLIKLALEWYAADQHMKQLATRYDREQQLKERIKREDTVRVPPNPAKLRESITWLTAHGYRKMAAKMRLVLDAALAFYDAK